MRVLRLFARRLCALVPVFVAGLVPGLVGGCASTAAPSLEDDYVLAFLRTGARAAEIPREQRSELGAGHMATVVRLAEARELVVAGPFLDTAPDPAMRGLYVFDAKDPLAVEPLLESDPAIAAGMFDVRLHRLRTATDLGALLERDLAARDERRAAGDTRMEAGMRKYVLALSEDGAAVENALRGDSRLVLTARLDGGPAGWHVLDAEDVPAARAWLEPLGVAVGELALYGWYGSESLAAAGAP